MAGDVHLECRRAAQTIYEHEHRLEGKGAQAIITRIEENRMDAKTYEAILDSINNPIVFVDNDHIIRYLNKPAKVLFYGKFGYSDLIGKSLFDCHDPASHDPIKSLHARLLEGENEIFVRTVNNRLKLTAIGVRDTAGQLIGYYERYDKTPVPQGPHRAESDGGPSEKG